MSTTFGIIEDLKMNWSRLSDPEKADRLVRIASTEISGRKLAMLLGRSESLLRHIKTMATATAADRELVRQGKLSTRAFVARTATSRRSIVCLREAIEILEWCRSQPLLDCDICQVIGEAQRILADCTEAGTLPRQKAPEGISLQEIIGRTRPTQDKESIFISYFAAWLARWSVFAYPDAAIRGAALEEAAYAAQDAVRR